MPTEFRKIENETELTCWVATEVLRKLDEVKEEPRSGVPGEEFATKSGPNEVTVKFTVEAATKTVVVKASYTVKDTAGAVVSDVVYGNEYSIVLGTVTEEVVEGV